ncbi:HK97 family phage portal protein [Frigoribacterium sp. PhB107]|uniref:phage portal protein n=1 Tax=Frigoribacterium sp. PhB107 TaxID=2485172 RepID=UPI000FB2231E|nr:phage portal protein [Frigoribacterium sp. PhB107]ROP78319.1 HK97 family phage portal protein [Frigoribacterium sp. PhB107]
MGLLDFIRGVSNEIRPNVPVEYINHLTSSVLNRTPEDMWRTQPALRSVVSFRARNVAQLGLHTFQRDGESRERVRDNPVAQLLRRPNDHQTTYELVYDLVAMLDLYDRAFWAVSPDDSAPSGWSIRSVPAPWVVGKAGGDFWGPAEWIIAPPGEAQFRVPASAIIAFTGWSPLSSTSGTPPIDALKQTLAEQISAQEFRLQMWKRGGRVGTYLTRPATAPKWDKVARDRFRDSFKEYTNSGSKAGGTPLLEDGIEMKRVGFTAREEEYIESAKLAISTVASVYHVNPTMIGQLDNANFANVREFRRMLYTETLGPLIAQIEDRLNAFLVPQLTDEDGVYVEFNIGEKLQGSFEEQAAVLSTSVGGPWMSRNEARGRNNLPAIEGGDELIVPLNVLVGGQASPQDGGDPIGTLAALASLVSRRAPSPAQRGSRLKARADEEQVDELAKVFSSFFERQARVVKSQLFAKAAGWWDEERWVKELTDDLAAAAVPLSTAVAVKALAQSGLDPDEYDEGRTIAYLRAVAANTAGRVNSATKAQLDAALLDDDPSAAIDNVFEVSADSRSSQAGQTLTTGVAMFATVEAVKQVGGDDTTKTWVVTSRNPRSSHAAMAGETVPINEPFSNGANWPGDSSALDVDEVAGCTCDVELTFP